MKEYMILCTFNAISKYRSVRRAFRRGHVDRYGRIYHKRLKRDDSLLTQ